MTLTRQNPLRIGTRASPLALAQAEMVKAALLAAHGLETAAVVIVPIIASGDKVQDRPLAEIGGKALWTKELEHAMIDREIDIAVHSMKDVETLRPAAFRIAAMLPRADVRDRLVGAASIATLPTGARIGTSSPRRAAQLRALRPDLHIVPLRGNVATRLAKIDAGEADATLLAAAGLDRLGMAGVGTAIEISEMLPAAAQGAIGIDRLTDRSELDKLLAPISHTETFRVVHAERALLAALGGSCHSPVAAHATIVDGEMHLIAEILAEYGFETQKCGACFALDDIDAPARLAARLIAAASPSLRALFAQ